MNFQDATMQGSKDIGGIRKFDIKIDKQANSEAKSTKPHQLCIGSDKIIFNS